MPYLPDEARRELEERQWREHAPNVGNPTEAKRYYDALEPVRRKREHYYALATEMIEGIMVATPDGGQKQATVDDISKSVGRGHEARLIALFGPEFDYAADDNDPRKAAARDYVRTFLMEADPRVRKPLLDRIHDRIDAADIFTENVAETCKSRILNRSDPENMVRQLDQSVIDLERANPEYVAARYNTPQKMERYRARNSYTIVYSGMQGSILASMGISSSDATLTTPYDMVQESISKAETSAEMYKNKIAMLDGVQKDMSATIHLHASRYDHNNLYAINNTRDSHTQKLSYTDKGTMYAGQQFGYAFKALFDFDQEKKMEDRGFSQFDLICINGKTAQELYGARYADVTDDAQKQTLMRAEVMNAMINEGARVDIMPIMMDKNGVERPTPINVKPSLEKLPSYTKPAWYQRWAPRLFATPEQRVEMAREKALKQNMKSPQVGASLTDTLQKAVQRVEAAEAIEAVANAKASETYVKGVEHDRSALDRAMFGHIHENTSPGAARTQIGNAPHINCERSGMSIGIAHLALQGHSFEDILNPDKLLREKAETGDLIRDMVAKGNDTSNPAGQQESKMWIADLQRDFAIHYENLPSMGIDHTNPRALAANYRELHCRAYVGVDLNQEYTGLRAVNSPRMGSAEFERLNAVVGTNANYYNVLAESMKGFEAQRAADARSGSYEDKVFRATSGIIMRKEIGERFNRAPTANAFGSDQTVLGKVADVVIALNETDIAQERNSSKVVECLKQGRGIDSHAVLPGARITTDWIKPVDTSMLSSEDLTRVDQMIAADRDNFRPAAPGANQNERVSLTFEQATGVQVQQSPPIYQPSVGISEPQVQAGRQT